MSQSTTKKDNNTRERILDVAEDIFSRYGYLNARVDDIAKAVGVRRPSLFHHFPNKQSIFVETVNRLLQREAEYLDEKLSSPTPRTPEEDLELVTGSTLNFLLDQPNISYLTLHMLASNRVDEMPTQVSEVSMIWWHSILERGRASGVFRDVSVAECIALLGGMATFYLSMRGSQTAMLREISGLERSRLRDHLQQLMRTLVLKEGAGGASGDSNRQSTRMDEANP